MQLNELPRQRQTEPGALDLLGRGPDLPKLLEDRLLVLRGDADPGSTTEISAIPLTSRARTSMRPPSGVNFHAFERRFSSACFTLRSSPLISPRCSSADWCKAIPRRPARSRTSVRALSMAWGQIEVRQFQLHPPVLDLGEIEDVVDQREPMSPGGVMSHQTLAHLLRPRWDLDPRLWARRCRRIVCPSTGTVVPV
jgi:hypothetical protein